MIGTRLGHYEVVSAIGKGGMGEVWRARDSKLGREVAIKTLPSEFAQDADRLARFEREARLLASLNHPHIAVIHGLEEHDGTRFLVLELVEGPTLADRIRESAIPVEEALELALEIADALEAAHEKGVVHRDLKPANIKLTKDGQVKVLDFGLAKAFAPGGDAGLSNSPTLSIAATRQGVILGTAGYMSPEQAKGEEAGKTADIWAFGIVLYEMLTGRQPFAAPSVAESLARILEREIGFDALPARTPSNIRRLLGRCLEKDAKRRLQHIGDARIEMTAAPEPPAVVSAPRNAWSLAIIAALLVVIAGLALYRPGASPAPEPRQFVVRAEPGSYIAPRAGPAISADGRRIAFGVVDAVSGAESERLLIQNLAEDFEPAVLVDSEVVAAPFFSPDGREVAFNDQNGLRRITADGGTSRTLVASGFTVGGSWITEDEMVLGLDWGFPLQRARLDGSPLLDLTALDAETGEQAHLWPQVLPGAEAVLFTVWSAAPDWDDAAIAVADLDSGAHRVVLDRGAYGRYAASGHLVFWRGGDLWAVAFDLATLETAGDPVRVVENVRFAPRNGHGHFGIADNGTLVYVPGGLDYFSETFVVDRDGNTIVAPERFEPGDDVVFSPDGRRVAMTLMQGGAFHVGVYDLERDLMNRLTSANDNVRPNWTQGGNRLTYMSNEGGTYGFYTRPADGSGRAERVLDGEPVACCSGLAFHPDGNTVLYSAPGGSGREIRVGHADGSEAARPVMNESGSQQEPQWSPDGRHFAYQMLQPGDSDPEIYVRPFPDTDSAREQVSLSGGWQPVWSSDGGVIYYAADEGIMAVAFDAAADPSAITLGAPELVLEMTGVETFDVSGDGNMFVVSRAPIETFATKIHVILNWFDELKQQAPVP